MADPFSLLAAAAGLADVSVKTSLGLRSLVLEFKHAPALILALSNEIAEISIALERVNESRQAIENLGDSQHDAAFLVCLDSQLNNARAALADLESLTAVLSQGKKINKRFRWLRQKNHAMELKGRLKEVRETINELLVAHFPSLGSRIKLELHDIRVGMQQARASAQAAAQQVNSTFQATNSEIVAIRTTMAQQQTMISSEIEAVQNSMSSHAAKAANHKQEVDDQLLAIRNIINAESQAVSQIKLEQTRQFEAAQTVQMAILTELAARSNTSVTTRRTGPVVQPVPSQNNFDSVIFFSMRLRGSHCGDGCRCRCHLPVRPSRSLQIPPLLQATLGYLFLGYTGYPAESARCNVASCAGGKYVRLQVTYSFPFWWCLRYALRAFVEASTSGISTFALTLRRRWPWQPGNIIYESQMGSTKALERMLQRERGCIQDIYDPDGRSALRLAITEQNPESIEIMNLLLKYGANPDQEDDFGRSPRVYASQAIFSKKYSPGYIHALEGLFPLSSCIEALELSYMHKIVLGLLPISLASALQKPVVDLVNAKDRFDYTPLMYAVIRGDVTAVSALIHAGAEVNQVDITGQTALHHATLSEVNQLAIGRKLIEAGADIHVPKPLTGSTPMWTAAFRNSVGIVRCLHDAGAGLESMNSSGETPLFAAVESGATEALLLLLCLGANTAHVNKRTRTLLHHAAAVSSLQAIRTCAGVGVRGQDAAARDQDGRTAQQLLDKRDPDSEMREAFVRLVRMWCSAEVDDDASAEEDCFYDAVEYLGGDEDI